MKKFIKIVAIIALLFSIFNIVSNFYNVYAWDPTSEIEQVKKENPWDKTPNKSIIDPTKSVIATAINVIRVVGTGIALIMLSYVGIKYMSAAPSEKADFKKSATAYVVGAIVLFGASNIISIIANFATNLNTTN
jgi:type IV secretory pathway VirB2 component (pilin)